MGRWGKWAILVLTIVAGAVTWAVRSPEVVRTVSRVAKPDQLGRDSQAALPRELRGVYLGMELKAFLAARRKVRRLPNADEPHAAAYQEALGEGSRVLYFVGQSTGRLEKLQIASQLADVTRVAPRVADHGARYGHPTGVWDCPESPGIMPTRRFSWTRGQVGVMDVYLVLADRVAATLYVAPTSVILDSLARAKCVRTTPERLTKFPTPNPAGMAGLREQTRGAPP